MIRSRLFRLSGACLLAAGLASIPPAGAAPRGDAADGCRIGESPEQTVEALRFSCDQGQLDHLYQGLHPGPMPPYGAKARGYWRSYPDARGADEPSNRLVNLVIWQGKVFYTQADGGWMMNRAAGDRESFRAAVYFGNGWLDGRPAIIVDYGPAGDPLDLLFRDEIRMVQPGVYLGIGWRNREQPPWTGGRAERITFVLDLVHPELSASDCPHCQVRLSHRQ